MSPLATSLRFLQTQSDARLVALARDGHEAAFEALIRRYRRRLLSYCRRIVGSEAAAEDVLQQALLQAWVAIGRGTEVNDPRAWLYRIVHNVAISSLRTPAGPAVELADADISSETDHEAEQRIAVRAALAGLAALPALQREVMLSTAVDGRSYDEIATELGLTSGAVRGLLYRARSTLRAAAAALIPTPLVNWAVRHASGQSSGSSGLYETIAGTGSAGVAGVLLKGGAVIASAGALATAVGISTSHPTLRLKPGGGATAVASAATAGQNGAAHQQVSAGSRGGLIAGQGGAASAGGTGGRGAGLGSSANAGGTRHSPRILVTLGVVGRSSGRGPSGHDGGGPSSSGGDGRGGGSRGGSDGGSSGSSGGSGGGHDGGHSDGGSGGGTTTSGGHDGGGSGTSGGSPTASGPISASGSDGGTDGHDTSGDGGSSSSGSDTTTTVGTTTTGSMDSQSGSGG